jgi:hypothetical protein
MPTATVGTPSLSTPDLQLADLRLQLVTLVVRFYFLLSACCEVGAVFLHTRHLVSRKVGGRLC